MHFSYFQKKTAAILDFGQNGTFGASFRDGDIKIPKLDKILPLKSWVRKKNQWCTVDPMLPPNLSIVFACDWEQNSKLFI